MRLGQSDERIRDLQEEMARLGYRANNGGPLDQDGVYRLSMQAALLDFQRDHGIPRTGDVDAATERLVSPPPQREVDRHDFTVPSAAPPLSGGAGPNAPRAIDLHSDPDATLLARLRDSIRALDDAAGWSWDERSERLVASALVMAKSIGIRAGDDLWLGRNAETPSHAAGSLLMLARLGPGASSDPSGGRIAMPFEDALRVEPEVRTSEARAIEVAHRSHVFDGLSERIAEPCRVAPRVTA